MRGDFANPLDAQVDRDLMIARRSLKTAQILFDGPTERVVAPAIAVGWHGSEVNFEAGATATVRDGGPYGDLVGRIIRVTRERGAGNRSVLVYVVGSSKLIPEDLSLSRRAFLTLGLLAEETLICALEEITVTAAEGDLEGSLGPQG
jgi:hypothetical protein